MSIEYTGADAPPFAPAANQLRKGALGVGAVTFFVISAAGPLVAIAGGAPIGMLLGNGPGMPGAYLITLLILLLFAVGYCALARHVTNAGAFYAFAARGLGGVAGGATSMIALVGYNTMQIGLYGLFGSAAQALFQQVGINLPWWVYCYVAMASIAVFGYRQVDLSAKVLSVLVACEYVCVLILDVAIMHKGGDAGLTAAPFAPSNVFGMSPSIGLVFCFACFVGFEATTIYGEEAKDPKRTIPLATYFSILLVGGFYMLSSWCMVNGEGVLKLVGFLGGLPDPTRFLFLLADRYVGHWLSLVMSVLFVTSVYAGLLAFHNSVARYFYAMGREGLLPDHFGKTHVVHQSPHTGSVAQTVIAAVVIGIFAVAQLDPVLALFSWLTNVGTLGVITLMAIASFAVPAFFHRNPGASEGVFSSYIAPVIAGVLLIAVLILIVTHFDLLTGTSDTLAYGLTGLILLAAIIGVGLALRLRAADYGRYLTIGHEKH
jgi:amino acid transporter